MNLTDASPTTPFDLTNDVFSSLKYINYFESPTKEVKLLMVNGQNFDEYHSTPGKSQYGPILINPLEISNQLTTACDDTSCEFTGNPLKDLFFNKSICADNTNKVRTNNPNLEC